MKIGQGFDAHRFDEPGTGVSIRMGGIDIPSDRSIVAHSDGDVLLHALCDAILGALGMGDIGEHFPDTDARYRDVDSGSLLQRCSEMTSEAGYRVINLDLTIIAQMPRIAPYRQQMSERIAEILKIPSASVNIKATTTEGMGFTGRGEGIAALGTVLLELNK